MTEQETEARTIAVLAQAAVEPHDLEPGGLAGVMVPSGHRHEVLDLERFLPAPRRTRATVELHTAGSLAAYVLRHKDAATTTLYADRERNRVVAVLNDAAGGAPGWGDHRAALELKLTREWEHWAGADNRFMSQQEFAEHIEAGSVECVDPSAAEMLELAQSLEVHKDVTFRSAARLADGQRQFRYEEAQTARAGQQGDITIPAALQLAIIPFEGSSPSELSARFRYRLSGDGVLKLGYVLVRPHDVLREAFEEAVAAIERGTELVAFMGTPPPVRV
jgi:uncharacterized protein YfdQ (DUF2303 family)